MVDSARRNEPGTTLEGGCDDEAYDKEVCWDGS